MVAQRTSGVSKKLEIPAAKIESVAQNPTNTLLEEPRPVNIPIPAVRESIFVAELNTNESFDEAGVVALIVANDPVRLRCLRSLKEYPGRGDYHVMAGYMPSRKPKWFDIDVICARSRETVHQFFFHFARLEGHHKQTQELWCLSTVVMDGLVDGSLESYKQVVGGEEARAQVSLDLKDILPFHSLDPALNLGKVVVREESHSAGINGGGSDRTRFTLCDMAYPLELEEIFWVSKGDA